MPNTSNPKEKRPKAALAYLPALKDGVSREEIIDEKTPGTAAPRVRDAIRGGRRGLLSPEDENRLLVGARLLRQIDRQGSQKLAVTLLIHLREELPI